MHPNAGDLEELYKDVHHHPELSVQEQRTAGLAVERLSAAGFEVTAGVVGLLRNGDDRRRPPRLLSEART
jgi:metal-dependent amidase/aminoacylase/carboxypeptidase family protein